MFPIEVSDEMLEAFVLNIIRAYHAATAEQIQRGRAWYSVAHDIAEMIGDGDVRKGAGVIAALSPNKKWSQNIILARDASNGDVHGTFHDALSKVHAILEDDADPESVLPMDAKTGHFFRNILDPEDPDPVTVDRWAYRVATDDWSETTVKLNHKRYATLALAYRLAARRLRELPSRVQPIVWIWARERRQ